jgi:hypothetical protein
VSEKRPTVSLFLSGLDELGEAEFQGTGIDELGEAHRESTFLGELKETVW